MLADYIREIKILQVKRDMTYTHGFMNLEMMKELKLEVDLNNYEVVYIGGTRGTKENDMKVLEELFKTFNTDYAPYFKGRSVSVSDIIKIDDTYYFCDSFGWQEINL